MFPKVTMFVLCTEFCYIQWDTFTWFPWATIDFRSLHNFDCLGLKWSVSTSTNSAYLLLPGFTGVINIHCCLKFKVPSLTKVSSFSIRRQWLCSQWENSKCSMYCGHSWLEGQYSLILPNVAILVAKCNRYMIILKDNQFTITMC